MKTVVEAVSTYKVKRRFLDAAKVEWRQLYPAAIESTEITVTEGSWLDREIKAALQGKPKVLDVAKPVTLP